jgi:hypothetical protein
MLYKEIPITLDGEIKYFNFDTIENDAGQECKIWSGNLEMKVDKDFIFIEGDLPVDWVSPAIDKLKEILGYSEAADV